MAEIRRCRHCGTPFSAETEDEEFCCSGCAHVHSLIEESGLERFYSLRGKEIEPVSPATARPADLQWLEAAGAEAEKKAVAGERPAALDLDLKGVSCIGCVWLLEELFRRQAGGRRISIQAQTGRARLEWNPGVFSPVAFAGDIRRFGYRFAPGTGDEDGGGGSLAGRIGVCAFLALNTMLFTLPGYLGMEKDFPFADLFGLLALLFATISYGVGGLWFVGRAWDAARMGVLHIDLPIALGVSVAWAGSLLGWLLGREELVYFDFVAIFILLMLAGRWVQERSVARNRARVRTIDLAHATLHRPGDAKPLRIADIRKGDRFSVPPGGTVPVLSLLEGTGATFSLESMNGEADAIPFETGGRIPSGAIVTSGETVTLRAAEAWAESTLHRLISEDAAPSRNILLERILAVYTGAVIGIALVGGAAWMVFGDVFAGLQVAVSVLVVSCPCSLGIAWPLINDLATGSLRRRGVYLRHGDVWSRLSRVRDAVFDKTGTLTLEVPRLLNPSALRSLADAHRPVLLALVEAGFHPASRALREELLRHPVRAAALDDFSETPGQGVCARRDGSRWSLGRAGWADGEDPASGGSVFARDGEVLARFHFEDHVREGAGAELTRLAGRGLGLAILSGDRQEKVDALAAPLPIPPGRAIGGLRPEEKAEWIERHAPGRALMIGDGANDAPAFARAICRGTPLLDKGILESRCDFFFTGRDLSGLRALFATADRRRRTLHAVFAFAVAYNTGAIALCLAGLMNPLLAAVLMPASALVTLGIASMDSVHKRAN